MVRIEDEASLPVASGISASGSASATSAMGTSSAAAASRASCRAARRAGPASFIVHVPFAAAASCASVFRFGAIEKANDLRQMGHRARISTSEGRMTRAAGGHAMPDQRHKSTAGTHERQWWNVNGRASGWQQSQAALAWRKRRSQHDITHLASLLTEPAPTAIVSSAEMYI